MVEEKTMNETVLMSMSEATRTLVDQEKSSVACVGQGKATPRSGLLIGNGEVLTVAVSAELGEEVPVQVKDQEYPAIVVGFDTSSGIALLRHDDLPGTIITPGELPMVGELCVTVACPIPEGHEVRLGLIRSVGGSTRLAGGRRVEHYFQTDSARFRGFAGAVVFAPDQRPLGITMPAHRREEGFSLPIGQLLEIAAELREGRAVGTGYLGVQATSVDLPAPNEEFRQGLLVTGVESDTPAERAGINVGTFVVSVGGTATADLESLFDALTGRRAGDELAIRIMRSEGSMETVNVKVVLRT